MKVAITAFVSQAEVTTRRLTQRPRPELQTQFFPMWLLKLRHSLSAGVVAFPNPTWYYRRPCKPRLVGVIASWLVPIKDPWDELLGTHGHHMSVPLQHLLPPSPSHPLTVFPWPPFQLHHFWFYLCLLMSTFVHPLCPALKITLLGVFLHFLPQK